MGPTVFPCSILRGMKKRVILAMGPTVFKTLVW
ncbi:uncharacterized protein G2W53_035559 [Senna tora]|uniref:Uncharacterized protein n=1 Tax=Senna tora TaxID=362788 RepID=A0A834STA9_9FABA|nr:uncharacterized protein G2W53_035559 [Senna tora]